MLFRMENSVEGELFINREGKSLELTIYLYLCYNEHEAPSSCNNTVYLSYPKNKNRPRTLDGTHLFPAPNFQVGHHIMDLRTGQLITRPKVSLKCLCKSLMHKNKI